MRWRDITISFVCLVFAASLLFTAGSRLDYINSARQEMKLIMNEPLENAPPSLAFASVAMGAFRGLLVDVLWIRMDKLKDEGQFFDAKQIAEWITTLQPRFAEVWDFQAWNMAYNISVTMPAAQPEERWRWVKNGFELLRDQAIVKNPKKIGLYRSLGLIFLHKIGGFSDDAHTYYKLQLALAIRPLISPVPDKAPTNEYFEQLADAPTQWSQITGDNQVVPFIEALRKADANFESKDYEFVQSYLSLRQMPGRFSPAAFDVIDRFRDSEALKKFDTFAKAFELRRTWKLEPELMQQLNQQYGPVDYNDPNVRMPLNWEHPDVHAIYWAARGLQMGSRDEYTADEINTDRIVLHSLQDLFRNGKMIIYEVPAEANETAAGEMLNAVFLSPDLRMFEPYDKVARATMEKYHNLGSDPQSMKDGHRNMLSNAVVQFYMAGHEKYAEKIYGELRQLYPKPEFNVPIAAFARKQLQEYLKNLDRNAVVQMMTMTLREGYKAYAIHDDDEAYGQEKMAREIFGIFQAGWKPGEGLPPDMPQNSEMIRFIALSSFINDEMFPSNLRLGLLNRMKLERPELYQQLEGMAKKLKAQSQQTEPNQTANQ